MQSALILALVPSLHLATATIAPAQAIGDFVAYVGLNLTPIGSFVPLPSTARDSERAMTTRYSQVSTDEPLRRFAASFRLPAVRGAVDVTVALATCEGCDKTPSMGASWTIPLSTNILRVGLRPALAAAKPSGGTVLAAAVGLPVSVELASSWGIAIVPFLEPSFGWARIAGEVDSDAGTRPMLGGGLMVGTASGRFSIHAGFQKVMLKEGDTGIGLGITIR